MSGAGSKHGAAQVVAMDLGHSCPAMLGGEQEETKAKKNTCPSVKQVGWERGAGNDM
jgi:hypothetical protein